MWISTLRLDPRRVLLTKLLGLVYPDIYYSSLAPLQVENLPRQMLPAKGWVRVRNRLAGICGSDLHLIHADGDLRVAPALFSKHRISYPGHEVVGEILEIDDDVRGLRVGDRVVYQSAPNCLSSGVQPLCRSCLAGNYNLCEYGTLPGPVPYGGGWSEEMLLHEQQLFVLPRDLNDEQAVLLEPTAVALHALLRCMPQAGERVLIVGAGSIGLLMLQLIRALSPATEVHVLARHAFQVEQATRLGAAHIIYPRHPYRDIQRATGAHLLSGLFGNQALLDGYDIVYDTVGTQRTIHDALRWTRTQGTLVLVGVSLHLFHLDLSPVWYRQINLVGSSSHGMEKWPLGSSQRTSTFSIVAELMQQGRIHPEQLITHRFALTSYKEALVAASDKGNSHSIKVVFDYSLLPASVVPTIRASAHQRRSEGPVSIMEPGDEGAEENLVGQDVLDRQALPVLPESELPLAVDVSDIAPIVEDEDSDADTAVAIPAVRSRGLTSQATSPAHEEPGDTSSPELDTSGEEAEEPPPTVRILRSSILAPVEPETLNIDETPTIPETPAVFAQSSLMETLADVQVLDSLLKEDERLSTASLGSIPPATGEVPEWLYDLEASIVGGSTAHTTAPDEAEKIVDEHPLTQPIEAAAPDEAEKIVDEQPIEAESTVSDEVDVATESVEGSIEPVADASPVPGEASTDEPVVDPATDMIDVPLAEPPDTTTEDPPVSTETNQPSEALLPVEDDAAPVADTPRPRSRRKKPASST